MLDVIEVLDLSYRYNQTKNKVFEKVNFSVKKGEFFFIIGPNSSGKSTLCNCLVGLIPHFFVGEKEGKVFINGKDTENVDIADLSMDIGLVFQNPFNQLTYAADTVQEELAYGLCNRGEDRTIIKEKIAEIARILHLEEFLDSSPFELSGGQVQRVAFGSIYILKPNILVLDESLTQLDPGTCKELMDVIAYLNHSGVTIIMVDHDMNRVAKYADRIMVLSKEKKPFVGLPEEVFTEKIAKDYQIELPATVKIINRLKQLSYIEKQEEAYTTEEVSIILRKVLSSCVDD